jgi:hypothetical protein
MMVIIDLMFFSLFEICLSIYTGFNLCSKTDIKSSSVKKDSIFTKHSITSLELLNLPFLRRTFLAACLVATVLPASDAKAAEVFTKDQGLEGSVVGVTAEGVEFETIYGKGVILVQWSDIEMIRSDKEFLALYG